MNIAEWKKLSPDAQKSECQKLNPYEEWPFFKEIEKMAMKDFAGIADDVFCGMGSSLGPYNCIIFYHRKRGIKCPMHYFGFPVECKKIIPINTIEFQDKKEIRMGSPFHISRILINGKPTRDLSGKEWQDIYAADAELHKIAFVKWSIGNNNPGFCIVLYDSIRKTTREFPRIDGICETIKLTVEYIEWKSINNKEGKIWLTTSST